ncbi:hypothetical protein JW613_05610 [Streptomyces smyrnaeus]|uniref:Transmembrane protein n=1 Tax=Streptomyces smyrnaeus TaxID=1387713 RepID=A0ABS3XQT8_9ACTN|nr:hypothetical protein [Streptomyces smyrnaeus]MBO8197779.1 hypothetical protein [Streptomyces smyrnaeus]
MGALPVGDGSGPSFRSFSPQDLREVEELVEEALRTEPFHEALRNSPAGTAERLRQAARDSAADLAQVAAEEYQTLKRAREMARSGGEPSQSASGLAREHGGGLLAAFAVLVPLISGAAAVIFLLLGHLLMLIDSQQDVGTSLVLTGWSGAGVAAVTGALGLGTVFVAARSHSRPSSRLRDGSRPNPTGERRVEEAHAAWRTALLERAVLPCLRSRLLEAGGEQPDRSNARTAAPRSSLGFSPGYEAPGFGSPEFGDSAGPSAE